MKRRFDNKNKYSRKEVKITKVFDSFLLNNILKKFIKKLFLKNQNEVIISNLYLIILDKISEMLLSL